MINTLKRAPMLATSLALVLFGVSTPASSQSPTDAQRSAIRSQCRSDYQAHCASIPPGGAASLQCLQQNMSSLSPGCQGAVRAVEAPAKPKAEAKPESAPAAKPAAETAAPATEPAQPAAETPVAPAPKAATAAKPAASPMAKKPSGSQIAAIRSACRSDYQRNCAGVPTGAAALQCLQKNQSKLSAHCEQAVSAASGATPEAAAVPSAAAPGAAPPAPPEPALVLRPMRPREELFVLRSACGGDVRALCAGVQPGGGRIIQCLATQAASLSPACKDVLGQFAAR
jgi:hypothetical protein